MKSRSAAKAGWTRPRTRSRPSACKPRAIGGRDAVRHVQERLVESALLRRLRARAPRPGRARAARSPSAAARSRACPRASGRRFARRKPGSCRGGRASPRSPCASRIEVVDDLLAVLNARIGVGANQLVAVPVSLDRHLVLIPEHVEVGLVVAATAARGRSCQARSAPPADAPGGVSSAARLTSSQRSFQRRSPSAEAISGLCWSSHSHSRAKSA